MMPTGFDSTTRNDDACDAYGDDFGSNEREGSLGNDTPPSDKSACGSRNVIVLDERTRVFPVTEADSETSVRTEEIIEKQCTLPVVIRPTSKVENNSEDDEANDGQDLDGSGDATR